ncbi:hypothetical protein NDU88_003865 [Pleurodeles waltl]|uniref:Uncharacterized protein n=1 Tax=Pleurodeles waltl TaxID=8319 RepID=A0AAV7TSH4_PLEWA|nr:hypothetical protein NDU88_003865 [Pleurodeles waltl]
MGFWAASRGPLLVRPMGRIGGFIGSQAPRESECGRGRPGRMGGATQVLRSAPLSGLEERLGAPCESGGVRLGPVTLPQQSV